MLYCSYTEKGGKNLSILISGKSALSHSHVTHHHQTWEIIANVEGEGVLEIAGEAIPFDSRTVVCIPPGVEHAKYSKEGYRDIWLWSSDFSILDSLEPIVLTDDSEHNITALMNILYSVRQEKVPNYKVIAESLFDSIQQLILSRLERKQIDPRIEEIIHTIIHHFHDPSFSLDDCLSRNGYCSDHMRRLFREQIGKTPHEYLAYLRIKSAKKLLSSRKISNYSVGEICTMVGFQDVSYFSRIFKKATGVPPSEYVEDTK